jgi:hypothetical protein
LSDYAADPGLLWGFAIHPDGSAEALDADRPIHAPPDGWLWLHFNLADIRVERARNGYGRNA